MFELSEFLVGELGVDDLGASYPHRVTYHPSCQGCGCCASATPRCGCCGTSGASTWSRSRRRESCCGFGGTFAIKNADTSAAMLTDKVRAILDTGAEVCTALDCSCLLHIGGGLSRQRAGVRTVHLAEILRIGADG